MISPQNPIHPTQNPTPKHIPRRGKSGKSRLKRAWPLLNPGDKTIEVTDDMTEATFTVPLKKGACDVHAQFIGDDGKAYGAYFLYVKREGQRKQQ